MPSDLAKKKAAKKKEAAKARQRPRRAPEENGDVGTEPQEVRPPEANGTALPGERPRRDAGSAVSRAAWRTREWWSQPGSPVGSGAGGVRPGLLMDRAGRGRLCLRLSKPGRVFLFS